MKKRLALIFLLVIGLRAFPTEWAWFYVYTENEYMQGPWSRTPVFSTPSYVYLHPTLCEALLGSGDEELAMAIVKNLQKLEPKKYHFKYELAVSGDTAVLSIPASNVEAIRNELIASFTLNNFKALRISSGKGSRLYTLQDLTIPYMDLRAPASGFKNDAAAASKKDTVIIRETIHEEADADKAEDKPSLPLIASIVLNCVLVFLLVRRNKK